MRRTVFGARTFHSSLTNCWTSLVINMREAIGFKFYVEFVFINQNIIDPTQLAH